jgi:hypothetical protein
MRFDPPHRRGPRPRQSVLSMMLEAAGGGLIIASMIVAIRRALGW